VLGLSDAFIRAAETATANPIFLVDLQITATENHKIISAVSSSLDYPISVAEVSQVSGSLDIVSRKVKISECSVVVFDDDLVRSIFEESSREPKGRFVNVLIGFDDLDESDFAPYFRGILDELTPRPGHIELVLKNHSAIALDAKASGIGWYNKHPLQGISDILDVAGVPADAINVSELHPDAAQNVKYKNLVSSPGIEFHTNASTGLGSINITTKSTGPINTTYQSVIESLAGMMHGACFTDEYGIVRFLPYDHDKAPIKHLTANDYRNFQQTGTYGNLCNHLKFIQKEGDGLENFVEFECEESQNAFMSPSGEKLKRTLVQNFSYCGVTDYTTTALLEPGGVANLGSESYDFDSRRTLEGISGLRITGSYPVTHWNTGGVSPDHPIYLLIDGSIIAVKEMQGTGSTSLNLAPGPDKKLVRNYSLGGVPQGMVYLPTTIRVTDTESGVLGTPEIEASDYFTGGVGIAQLSFIDVTAAVLWAEDYFKRFGHGCPTINIETSLDHYDLQIGDFITLDEAGEFYFDHKSGLSDSTVLEIVGKETHMTPSGAYISFKLAFVRRDGLPILTIAAGFGSFPILDFWYSLQLAVDVTGFWRFWVAVQGVDFNVPVLQGSDADLATGGGLATGKGGIYDVNTAASTCTRSYDNFYWWQPAADVSLVANQTMEWRHDGAIAEDAAGEVWVPKALDGDPALIPASGRDSRPLRTVILASRGDPRSGGADSGIDDISARWTLRPRIITVPTS